MTQTNTQKGCCERCISDWNRAHKFCLNDECECHRTIFGVDEGSPDGDCTVEGVRHEDGTIEVTKVTHTPTESKGVETHDSGEVEKMMRECEVLFDGIELAKAWFRKQITQLHQSHHQELQKARHDWLREEIVKLEQAQINVPKFAETGFVTSLKNAENWTSHNKALQTIIDRYQSELDQPTV